MIPLDLPEPAPAVGAWHIAYRRMQNNDAMWRPYGTIIAREGQRHLIHENGHMQSEDADANSALLRFQTFFGPSPIEFRLARLTQFTAEIDFPSLEAGPLRFIGLPLGTSGAIIWRR